MSLYHAKISFSFRRNGPMNISSLIRKGVSKIVHMRMFLRTNEITGFIPFFFLQDGQSDIIFNVVIYIFSLCIFLKVTLKTWHNWQNYLNSRPQLLVYILNKLRLVFLILLFFLLVDMNTESCRFFNWNGSILTDLLFIRKR